MVCVPFELVLVQVADQVEPAVTRDVKARSGDPAAIAAHLGKKDRFERSITDFAERDADQHERDYQAFADAVRDGRLTTVADVCPTDDCDARSVFVGWTQTLAVPERVGPRWEVINTTHDFVAVLLVQCLGLESVGEVHSL